MLNAIVIWSFAGGIRGGAAAVFWLAAVVLQAAEPATQSTAAKAAQLEPAWDEVFSRSHGWNGGDVAGTVDLGDGRVVWLFGDTFVGPLADGKRLPGNVMINNSLAVHGWNSAAPRAPTPGTIEFVFGKPDAEGRPTALFAPQRVPPSELDDELDAMRQFWPSGGGFVAEADGKRRLIVGLFVIRKTKEHGAFAFRRVGNALGIIDDVRRSPAEWSGRVVDIPHAVGDQMQSDGVASLSWGEQFLRAPNDQANVYVFGVRSPRRGPRELVAARAPADSSKLSKNGVFALRTDVGANVPRRPAQYLKTSLRNSRSSDSTSKLFMVTCSCKTSRCWAPASGCLPPKSRLGLGRVRAKSFAPCCRETIAICFRTRRKGIYSCRAAEKS